MSSSVIKAELEKEFLKLGYESKRIRRPEKSHQKRLKKSFQSRKYEDRKGSTSSKRERNLEKLRAASDHIIDSKIVESVLDQDSRLKRTSSSNTKKEKPIKEETVFTDEDFEAFARDYFVQK